jgi:hypothetical protein
VLCCAVQVVPRQCALAAPALLPFQQPLSTSQEACSQQQSAAGPAMYVAAAKQRCVCPLLVNGSFDWLAAGGSIGGRKCHTLGVACSCLRIAVLVALCLTDFGCHGPALLLHGAPPNNYLGLVRKALSSSCCWNPLQGRSYGLYAAAAQCAAADEEQPVMNLSGRACRGLCV